MYSSLSDNPQPPGAGLDHRTLGNLQEIVLEEQKVFAELRAIRLIVKELLAEVLAFRRDFVPAYQRRPTNSLWMINQDKYISMEVPSPGPENPILQTDQNLSGASQSRQSFPAARCQMPGKGEV